MSAADDIHKYFSIVFSEKIILDVLSESSARQRIHMKNQALFSSKDKNKKLKCRLLQFLFGALRVILVIQMFRIFMVVFFPSSVLSFCSASLERQLTGLTTTNAVEINRWE